MQAHEMLVMAALFELRFANVLRADQLNGPRMRDCDDSIGPLRAGLSADISVTAVISTNDITVMEYVSVVMQGGRMVRQ